MPIKDILGDKVFDFYGVCTNCFKLNDLVFEAVEDPDDGYRSYLSSVILTDSSNLTFASAPLCKVRVTDGLYEDGFKLETPEGISVLEVGTCTMDNYYPCFRFEYTLPASLEAFEKAKAREAVLQLYSGHKASEMFDALSKEPGGRDAQ